MSSQGNREVVVKPWGQYENLLSSDNFKVKILTILPEETLSLQRHFKRAEHWTVVQGSAFVLLNSKVYKLYPGDSLDIDRSEWHRIANNHSIPLVIVETQIGECYEEDIERAEDKYGRADI